MITLFTLLSDGGIKFKLIIDDLIMLTITKPIYYVGICLLLY